MPVRKHPVTGETMRIDPLYRKNGETVFETRAMPGRYELFRIVRKDGGMESNPGPGPKPRM